MCQVSDIKLKRINDLLGHFIIFLHPKGHDPRIFSPLFFIALETRAHTPMGVHGMGQGISKAIRTLEQVEPGRAGVFQPLACPFSLVGQG